MEKEVKHFLYSWQDRDPNLIEITILTQDGIDSCLNTTYCIYDRQGKAIDSFIMNSSCKEDKWDFEEYGKFISHDTYEKTEVELDEASLDTLSNKEIMEGDSTIFHYVISKEGKVTEKEIYKKHFTKVLRWVKER